MKKLFWLVQVGIIVVFAFAVMYQYKPYAKYFEDEQRLLLELENEKKIAMEIEDEKNYQGTEAYIEKIAREKLGYVKPNEYVFINIAE